MSDGSSVAVIGVSGFVGRGLPKLLHEKGFRVLGVSRSGGGDVVGVEDWQSVAKMDLAGCHAVVNLAGESIDRRWSSANRKKFYESRIGVTRKVVDLIRNLPADQRPKVLVNASAVGIYGDRGDEELNEQSDLGSGYLADLCREWEDAAMEAESFGVRVVCLRIGVVLGRGGSAFEKLVRVMKTGLGGKLGHGLQWMPWIHVDDLRRAIVEAVVNEQMRGAVNAVAPLAERNADFTRKFARHLRRPAVLPVPAFALKLALGGFAGVLLASQRVRPAALESLGFHFRCADFKSALDDLLGAA
ncbi:MAG: hypothetical protein RLZ22_1227 [Verrucomicrobiota bacterium]|jgi:uncharacterized protein (TIGR01777 family)